MINTYSLVLNEDKIPYLKKDKEVPYDSSARMTSPGDIVEMVNKVFDLCHLAEEHVIMLSLDSQKRIIGLFEISHGTVSNSVMNPASILKRALLCNAASYVLIHNHPSGDVSPSRDDMKCAESLKEAAKLMGMGMDDFIIIGNEYFSFYEQKML